MAEVFKRSFVKIERKGLAPLLLENVYFLTMSNKMNILSFEMIDQLNEAYDFMENKTEGPACLVTCSSLPKIFSAGLNLKYMLKVKGTPKRAQYLEAFQALLTKLLKLPIITIAAINGHAYAAGLALALCHDYRIMNKDFGHLCMSEIKYGLAMASGVNNVCKHRISLEFYKYIVLTGEPIGPEAGLQAKMIEELIPLSNLKERAFEMGVKLAESAKNRQTLKTIKSDMNQDLIAGLSNKKPHKEMMPNL